MRVLHLCRYVVYGAPNISLLTGVHCSWGDQDAQGVYLILGVQEGAFNRQDTLKRERRLFS